VPVARFSLLVVVLLSTVPLSTGAPFVRNWLRGQKAYRATSR
jgi:hypothetical protein